MFRRSSFCAVAKARCKGVRMQESLASLPFRQRSIYARTLLPICPLSTAMLAFQDTVRREVADDERRI